MGRTSTAGEYDEQARRLREDAAELLLGAQLAPAALCCPQARIALARAWWERERAEVVVAGKA